MKWIAALLMITNVAVFLWASGRQDVTEQARIFSSPDVNIQGMLLLSEASGTRNIGTIQQSTGNSPSGTGEQNQLDTSGADQSTVGDNKVTALDFSGELIVAEDLIEDGNTTVASVNGSSESLDRNVLACYRIGPFRKDDPWKSAKSWMGGQEIAFKHVTSESRELLAVRVFLGPYSSAIQTESAIRILKKKNLDYFVYEGDTGTKRVSLGYFTQEELATKFLGYLESIDVQAKSQPEYRTLGPFNWMEISANGVDLDLLTSHNWKASNISLSRVGC